jgi:hypothetical protein
MTTSLFEGPRKRPVTILVSHVAVLVFWLIFAAGDLLDGHVKLRRGRSADAASDPATFYLFVAVIIAATIFLIVRATYAALVLVGIVGNADRSGE